MPQQSNTKSAGVEPANGSIKTSCLNLLATTYNSKISPFWPSAYEYWISSSLVKNFDLGKVSQGSPPQGGTKGITLLFTCVHYLVSYAARRVPLVARRGHCQDLVTNPI